jgi:hypothetical protein
VLRATPRQDIPSIPVPPLPPRNLTRDVQASSSADTDDFKELMRSLYNRPYPK